jgi:hypothetical protein
MRSPFCRKASAVLRAERVQLAHAVWEDAPRRGRRVGDVRVADRVGRGFDSDQHGRPRARLPHVAAIVHTTEDEFEPVQTALALPVGRDDRGAAVGTTRTDSRVAVPADSGDDACLHSTIVPQISALVVGENYSGLAVDTPTRARSGPAARNAAEREFSPTLLSLGGEIACRAGRPWTSRVVRRVPRPCRSLRRSLLGA